MTSRRWGTRRLAGAALAIALAGCGGSVLPQIHSEAERFEVAERLAREHDYGQSIGLLKPYVENNAGSALVDEAIYLLGDDYLHVRDYTSAQLEFERLLRDYPESDSSASASFRLGEALLGQSRGPDFDQEYTFKALDQWKSYQRNYPGHWLQPEAARRIFKVREQLAAKYLKTAHLYFKMKFAEPARAYYQRVLDDYGDTPAAGEAAIGVALADEMAGFKADAIARLHELVAQYPGQPIAARAAHELSRLEHK